MQLIPPSKPVHRIALLALCTLATLCASGIGQEVAIPRTRHPWGRFEPGSWSQVRKVIEELDEYGNVRSTSVSETKTTLIEADEQGFTLLIEVTVEVAGRRMSAKPKMVELGYHGEASGEMATVRRVSEDSIRIAGKSYECVVLESTVVGTNKKQVSTIHYSDRVAPYILRRDTRTLDEHGQPNGTRTLTEVLAVQMPHKVFTEIRTASHVRVLQSSSKGTTCTMEVHCEDIPGAVVAHTSKEMDQNGKVTRRSTLELTAFSVSAPDNNRFMGLREWLRQKRARKASYHFGR